MLVDDQRAGCPNPLKNGVLTMSCGARTLGSCFTKVQGDVMFGTQYGPPEGLYCTCRVDKESVIMSGRSHDCGQGKPQVSAAVSERTK